MIEANYLAEYTTVQVVEDDDKNVIVDEVEVVVSCTKGLKETVGHDDILFTFVEEGFFLQDDELGEEVFKRIVHRITKEGWTYSEGVATYHYIQDDPRLGVIHLIPQYVLHPNYSEPVLQIVAVETGGQTDPARSFCFQTSLYESLASVLGRDHEDHLTSQVIQ